MASPYRSLNLDKITCHIYIEILINQFENTGVSTLLHCRNDLFQTQGDIPAAGQVNNSTPLPCCSHALSPLLLDGLPGLEVQLLGGHRLSPTLVLVQSD